MCNICLLNIWPLTVTLTLSWHMGSAHPLVKVNVSFKVEGNPSISKGVIERTRIGDGRTDRPTRQSESSIGPPPTFCGGGIIIFISFAHYVFYHSITLFIRQWTQNVDQRRHSLASRKSDIGHHDNMAYSKCWSK